MMQTEKKGVVFPTPVALNRRNIERYLGILRWKKNPDVETTRIQYQYRNKIAECQYV